VKIVYLCIGIGCLGVGALGVLLPGLPTSPFLALAAWAFALSSQRLHTWLTTHPRFGPPIQLWQAHRVIPRPMKCSAITMMGLSLGSAIWIEAPLGLLTFTGATMAGGAVFVLRCPSQAPFG
jgi:uncharacterized membrane protein YbaN (DUF454 family)